MGLSLSWIAVPAVARHAALSFLGDAPTGRREAFPEFAAVAVGLSSGWFVILENTVSTFLTSDLALKRLSRTTDVLTCTIEEHAMVSMAAFWRGGTMTWRVHHDTDSGLADLDVSGQVPSQLVSLREVASAKQAGGDR